MTKLEHKRSSKNLKRQKTKPLQVVTNALLRSLWVALVSLLSINMISCAHKSASDVEAWMIDPQKVVLYRYTGEDTEDVIPIQMNRDVRQFMCLDHREYEELINRVLKSNRSD